MKQKELSRWIKGMVIVAGVIGLIFCFLVFPSIGKDIVREYPAYRILFWPSLLFLWVSAVLVYVSLYKVMRIAGRISRDNSFCEENAVCLKYISIMALLECVLYFMAGLTLFIIGLLHPGLLFAILLIQFAGLFIAVFTALLSHLVQKASMLKQENDLTI